MDPTSLGEVLQEWLPVLERVLGPHDPHPADKNLSDLENPLEPDREKDHPDSCSTTAEAGPEEQAEVHTQQEEGVESSPVPQGSGAGPEEPIHVSPPRPLPSDLLADLSQLASLSLDLGCFHSATSCEEGASSFLRRYFFLLDPEHVQRTCGFRYQDQPKVREAFIAGLLGETPPPAALIYEQNLKERVFI